MSNARTPDAEPAGGGVLALLGLPARVAARTLGDIGALARVARELPARLDALDVRRGAEVAAALPTLQRAVGLAEPLEGAVERLGRVVDRLPGSARARRAAKREED